MQPDNPNQSLPDDTKNLTPKERADLAYKMAYGEDAEPRVKHYLIKTPQDADWFVCGYLGEEKAKSMGMLAEPEIELGDLLKWLNQTDLVS